MIIILCDSSFNITSSTFTNKVQLIVAVSHNILKLHHLTLLAAIFKTYLLYTVYGIVESLTAMEE